MKPLMIAVFASLALTGCAKPEIPVAVEPAPARATPVLDRDAENRKLERVMDLERQSLDSQWTVEALRDKDSQTAYLDGGVEKSNKAVAAADATIAEAKNSDASYLATNQKLAALGRLKWFLGKKVELANQKTAALKDQLEKTRARIGD